MDKLILVLVGAAASFATYFWGQQSGIEKVSTLHTEQQVQKQAEVIGQLAQYHTLLKLDKKEELLLLLKSRAINEKAQLEIVMTRSGMKPTVITKSALSTVDELIQSE